MSLTKLLINSIYRHGEKILFAKEKLSYADFGRMVNQYRHRLINQNFRHGDRVVVIGNNSPNWAAIYFATVSLGGMMVPMYRNQLDSFKQHVITQTKPKLVFTENTWDLSAGTKENDIKEESDGGVILYTSGTTSNPKGVILTHNNIISNISAINNLTPVDFVTSNDLYLNFIPWSHCYGMTCELTYLISKGSSVYINNDLSRLMSDIKQQEPTIMCVVPQFLNNIYKSPKLKFIRDGQKLLFHTEYTRNFIRKTIFGKNFRFCTVGGSSISPDILDFFNKFVPVYQGYGLTETSPLVSLNTPLHTDDRSVGKILPCNNVFIHHGEILVVGDNVAMGYYNNIDDKSFTMTSNGKRMFKTGDKGFKTVDGYLYITGRIKEEYKLSNGKYVFPNTIENRINTLPSVHQCMIYGDGRPYNIVIIVTNNKKETDFSLLQQIKKLKDIRVFEMPNKVLIVHKPFSVEDNTLTAKFSLKRDIIVNKYKKDIELLYT